MRWTTRSAVSCWSPSRARAASRNRRLEFLQACRQLADQHQAALIFDEIQCGLGRTGQLFAFQHFGVVPDVVCIAKPIAAGLPLGAFLAKERFAQHITPGKHGTTFGGGPLTCRVALEYLAILEDENLLEQVRRVGAYFSQKLRELVDKFDIAVEVRGVGAIQALQLTVPGQADPGRRARQRSADQRDAGHGAALLAAVPVAGEARGQRNANPAQAAGRGAEGTEEDGEECESGREGVALDGPQFMANGIIYGMKLRMDKSGRSFFPNLCEKGWVSRLRLNLRRWNNPAAFLLRRVMQQPSMIQVDGLWVHQGAAEPGRTGDRP